MKIDADSNGSVGKWTRVRKKFRSYVVLDFRVARVYELHAVGELDSVFNEEAGLWLRED